MKLMNVRIIAPSGPSSLLLIDEEEQIVVDDHELLANFLQCDVSTRLKVVSIFGNTGDGKSHTLNHVFFNGQEVFRTSPEQHSCTVGVWVAYAPHHRALVIDTEGLLGTSKNENRRLRMLLKTLAISDVVVYRTRAERLHNDMFLFLSDASNAYWKYFAPELQAASQRNQLGYSVSTLGPSVVIFHETQFTQALSNNANAIGILSIDDDDIDHRSSSDEISAEEFLMRQFTELSLPRLFLLSNMLVLKQ
jgi:zinc finger FYVE domain-containing protein 1